LLLNAPQQGEHQAETDDDPAAPGHPGVAEADEVKAASVSSASGRSTSLAPA
jgi:hypothetical protein